MIIEKIRKQQEYKLENDTTDHVMIGKFYWNNVIKRICVLDCDGIHHKLYDESEIDYTIITGIKPK